MARQIDAEMRRSLIHRCRQRSIWTWPPGTLGAFDTCSRRTSTPTTSRGHASWQTEYKLRSRSLINSV